MTNEFAHQGQLEKDAGIPSCLFNGPPTPGDIADLANRQLGFMNIFAHDLFSRMSDILPEMQFTVDNINANKVVWQRTLVAEQDQKSSGTEQPVQSMDSEDMEANEIATEQAYRTQSGSIGRVRPGQPQEVPDEDIQHQEIASTQPQAVRPAPPQTSEAEPSSDNSSMALDKEGHSAAHASADSSIPPRSFELRDHGHSASPIDFQEVSSRRSSGESEVFGVD